MKALLLILLLLLVFVALPQTHTEVEQQIEQLAEREEEVTDDDSVTDILYHLLRHPVNINTATEEMLHEIPFLNPLQIQQLLLYRKKLGPLLHIAELQAVPGWDLQTIRKSVPYITVETVAPVSVKNIFSGGNHQLLIRLRMQPEKAQGYDRTQPGHFSGDPLHGNLRYLFSSPKQLDLGWTAEKDAGEKFRSPAVFDFHSFHFFLRRKGLVRSVYLGDYTVNMGQGLVQWQSMAFKKSSQVLSVKRQSPVIRPYRSSGEFYFNRGIALRLERRRFTAHAFFSLRNLDANTDSNLLLQRKTISSFSTSGLHRTKNELTDRAAVQQISYGGTLQYAATGYKIGLNAVSHHFSIPIHKKEPYQYFSVQGTEWMNVSIDYSMSFRNLHFFGEAAMDKRGAMAVVHGLLLALDKKADLSLLYRRLATQYQSVYGNAFTEQTLPSNENGLYAGISLRPGGIFRADAYMDLFHFPWIKFRTDAPSYGKDLLLQLTCKPNKRFEMYARYKYEEKHGNETRFFGALHNLVSKSRQNIRVHAVYDLTPLLEIKTRMEGQWFDKKENAGEQGFLFYAEGTYRFPFIAIATFRLQFFETDGFNSRIYAYESDALYGFSIPALYDKGLRYYAQLRYDVSQNISCWLRFAQTVYNNRTETGSGLNLIKGNTASEVKIQASYRF